MQTTSFDGRFSTYTGNTQDRSANHGWDVKIKQEECWDSTGDSRETASSDTTDRDIPRPSGGPATQVQEDVTIQQFWRTFESPIDVEPPVEQVDLSFARHEPHFEMVRKPGECSRSLKQDPQTDTAVNSEEQTHYFNGQPSLRNIQSHINLEPQVEAIDLRLVKQEPLPDQHDIEEQPLVVPTETNQAVDEP